MTNEELTALEGLLNLMRAYGVSRLCLRDSRPDGDVLEIEMREPVGQRDAQPLSDPMTDDLAALEARRAAGAALSEPMDEPCGCSPSPTDTHWKEIDHNVGGCLHGCDVAKCAQPVHQVKP